MTYPQRRANGYGHDALLAQSLHKPCGLTHMPTLPSCAWPEPVDRLEVIGPDALGMADMTQSSMILGALPPSVLGTRYREIGTSHDGRV